MYEQYVTIADKQLAALKMLDRHLSGLNLSTANAIVILDKLMAFTDKLLRRGERAGMLRALSSHHIRWHLEDGLCNLLTRMDRNLSAMQVSDVEAYDHHRMELVNVGMELVKAAPPIMSLSIDHLNVLINKYCQDREGLIDILMYNEALKVFGKRLEFEEKKYVNESEQVSQIVKVEDTFKESSMMTDDAGFNVDEMYMRPTSSYSFVADLSDVENPF